MGRSSGTRGTLRTSAAVITLGTLVLAACANDGGRSRRFLSIGTAGTGGIYYPLGGALASRLSIVDSLHRYTAEVTGGSVENINRVATGEMDLGMSMATSAYEAYHGGRDFAEPIADLRIAAPLYPNLTHVLVPAGSAARSVADFRGRRVSVGSPGSGTEQLARQVLEAYRLSYDDVDVRYLSFRESADALRDGAIDAAIISVGYPAAAVLEVTTTRAARLLPIDSVAQARLAERYPYYRAGVIPEGAYPGVTNAIPTVAVMNWIVVRESLEHAVVWHLLEILRTGKPQLTQVSAIADQIDLDALSAAPIPLHAAAVQWLEERGPDRP